MTRHLFLFLALLFVLLSCSKEGSREVYRFQGATMGTQYHVTIVSLNKLSEIRQAELKKHIDAILLDVNQQMSTYIPTSEISQFNQFKSTDWFSVSPDFALVVSNAQKVSKHTRGAFDISMAPFVDLWGFGAKTQLSIPTNQHIKEIKKNVGYHLLAFRLQPPALRKQAKNLKIDLSAIAKGFAVDKISDELTGKGFLHHLVEIGGEVHVQGFNQKGKPWRIGIQVPEKKHQAVSDSLLLSNMSLATSGDYQNYFIKNGLRYSHTIDPSTGKPITHKLASITVLHQSTMLADAYATALTVMGEKKGKSFAEDNNIHVNMIIREQDTFHHWQNIDEIKEPQSAQNCLKEGGCAYLDVL